MTMTDHGTSVRGGTDWRADAACLGADVNLFFPPERDDNRRIKDSPPKPVLERAAKAICAKCPIKVKQACLQFALDIDDRWAVLGGLTPAERRAMFNPDDAKVRTCAECGVKFVASRPSDSRVTCGNSCGNKRRHAQKMASQKRRSVV